MTKIWEFENILVLKVSNLRQRRILVFMFGNPTNILYRLKMKKYEDSKICEFKINMGIKKLRNYVDSKDKPK